MASLSELIAYAQAKAPRNTLADIAYSGLSGYKESLDTAEDKRAKRIKNTLGIAELSKTLQETKNLQSQAELNNMMIRLFKGEPLSDEERTAASSAALDVLGPVTKGYISGNRPTPITKTEKIQAVAEPGQPDAQPSVTRSDQYDPVFSLQNGKLGFTLQPKAKTTLLNSQVDKTNAETDLIKTKTNAIKTGANKPKGAGAYGVEAEKTRKMARDMAIREQITKQKAAGTYFAETFKYEPTEDEIIKYLPIAKQYLGGNSTDATKAVNDHLKEIDILGKFHK